MFKSDFWKKFVWILIGLIFLGVVSLYLGGGYLVYPLKGGDSANALFHINYLYQYWPKAALWEPNYGAGLSLVGINYGAYWFPAMTARLFGWLPIQAMHFWQWLSIYATSVGIMVLGWMIIAPFWGILAGLFFLLSNISWIWDARVGLFSFQESFIFVPLFFIFLHKALYTNNQDNKIKVSLYTFLASIALALAYWFHLVTGVLVAEAALIYALLFSPKVLNFFTRIKYYFRILFLSLLLSSFWWVPFTFYNERVLKGRVDYFDLTSLPIVPWKIYFGIQGFTNQVHDIFFSFFALPVLILCLIGIILGVVRKNKLIINLFLISVFFFLQSIAKSIVPDIVRMFVFFFSLVNTRAILITIIFLPIIASFGVYAFSDLIFCKLNKGLAKSALVIVLSVFITVLLVWKLDRLPSGYLGYCDSSYGPEAYGTDVDCQKPAIEIIKSRFKAIFSPTKQEIAGGDFMKKVASLIPEGDNVRADITPRRGNDIQYWGLVSPVSILQSSNFITKIPIDFLSYHNDAYYKGKGNKEKIEQMANWFGLDYLILDSNEPEITASFANWPVTSQYGTIEIHQSPYSTYPVGLATHSNRPAILFFGDQKQDAYFKWWQLLVNGGLDYNKAFIVDGGRGIEYFNEDELTRFSTIFFWGEEYKNARETDKRIKKFLENGGRIVIDTGWEYTAPFWKKENLPDWMPVSVTDWQKFTKWQLTSSAPNLSDIITFWNPPKWDGDNWGAAVVKRENLRQQASPLITDDLTGEVLAAKMPYGKGEIIWTGLNLVGMAQMKETRAGTLVKSWLEKGEDTSQTFPINLKRRGPEKIEIALEGQSTPTWLYFRESFYPSWQAKSGNNKLDYYYGGPALMLVYLPAGTTKVTLSHNLHWTIMVGGIVSAIVFIGMVVSISYLLIRKLYKKSEI
ncbi:MAG: hypothetical protein A2V72_02410 [Candidatus Nealsonbacteria bacterium RBG_13_37_56]|uniref:Membrane protein 6-pyruvoyl-tetrahydropterin synthase-related domain-containing protein n=1 Tax=Candidatus Nealsonbacteria bacterium RBG_13_37_56 TaxID=1801661 RepID=A0A1G2DVY4_9BACT|nr:MAG: hypothetical protein A2V72_02410 [Candidatus Nealsonbacteria bacterium RBG_13_37_56]HJX45588.1 hypothetical protein [Patescibacteria group bacterium]